MSRLLLGFAALVALSAIALVAYDPTDPPQTAVAATDCVATPGAHRLGDTLLHIPPQAARRARARLPRRGRDRGRLRGRHRLLRRRRRPRLRRALPERRRAPVLEPQRRDGHDRPGQPARADPAGARSGLHRPRLRHRRVQRRRLRGARRRASSTTSSRSPPSPAATARSTAARRPAASPCSRSTAPPTTSSPTAASSPTTPAPSRRYLAGWAKPRRLRGPTGQHSARRRSSPTSATARCAAGLAVEHLRLDGRRPRLAGRGLGPRHQRGRPALLRRPNLKGSDLTRAPAVGPSAEGSAPPSASGGLGR